MVAAFEDFLRHFKSSSTETEDALQDLHLDGDGTSDEYDFMDDVDDGADISRSRSRQKSKTKYMNMLQDIADRTTSQVLIDLDDLRDYETSLDEDTPTLRLVSSIEDNAHHYIEVFSRANDGIWAILLWDDHKLLER